MYEQCYANNIAVTPNNARIIMLAYYVTVHKYYTIITIDIILCVNCYITILCEEDNVI